MAIEKKEKTGYIIGYNIEALPEGWTMKKVVEIVKNENILYYDSSVRDIDLMPQLIHLGGDKNKEYLNLKLIDVSGKQESVIMSDRLSSLNWDFLTKENESNLQDSTHS